jgi:hypothetical protein
MKPLFTFAMVMAMVFQGYAASNNDHLTQLSGVSYSNQRVKVTLLEGAGKVKISILDENGVKVHGDFVEVTDSIVYPINMSSMPAGKYKVRLATKEGKIDHTVEIKPRSHHKTMRDKGC